MSFAAAQPRNGWKTLLRRLSLTDRDVHVWRASLDLPSMHAEEFARTLSEDEMIRARRFSFERDRGRFIACRGVLRAILGRYLGTAPGAIVFRYGAYGKPALSAGSEGVLSFNVSHACGTALYAISIRREIGIDLECIRAGFVSDSIAGQCFSPNEIAALRGLAPALRVEAFFRCWTRKEAYIKARGDGLSLPLDRFDVSLAPGDPAALLATPDNPAEASRWSLRELFPRPGYVAAIAVEGHDWRLRCWQWPDAWPVSRRCQ